MKKILIFIAILMIFIIGFLSGLLTATKVSLEKIGYSCHITDVKGEIRPIINCHTGYYFKFWTQYEEDHQAEHEEEINRKLQQENEN